MKVNLFPAFTAPFQLIFLSNISKTGEVPLFPKLVANFGKASLHKGTARSNNGFFYLNYSSFYHKTCRIELF